MGAHPGKTEPAVYGTWRGGGDTCPGVRVYLNNKAPPCQGIATENERKPAR